MLVAQDLASFGRDQGGGERSIDAPVAPVAARVDRVRLLYLYPSELNDRLVDAVTATGVPVLRPLAPARVPAAAAANAAVGGRRSLPRADRSPSAPPPEATFRSNFIVGYPGETEADHDALLAFVDEAQLDWCGFFSYSAEAGTYATGLDGAVPARLVAERLVELTERQDTHHRSPRATC